MKERPIPFNAPMVRAILAGQKTQTRRVMKPQPNVTEERLRELGAWVDGFTLSQQVDAAWQHGFVDVDCPYGRPGDRLFVQEDWQTDDSLDGQPSHTFAAWPVRYEADGTTLQCGAFFGNTKGEKRHARHMPQWASRILLEIVSVRAERLQDISDADAIAEGIGLNESAAGVPMTSPPGETLPVATFRRDVWEPIYGDDGWNTNPWVWVVEFRRVEA